MQAIILLGGFGTRLVSITEKLNIPKSMVPVLGKPFLEYLILMLKNKGIENFIFCTGYQAEKIKDYFGDGSKLGVKIVYSHEKKPLMSAGAVKLAEDLLENEFFVINGDDYFPQDYKEMLRLHKERNALVTISGKKWKEGYRGKYAGFSANEKNIVNSYLASDSVTSINPTHAFFAVFLIKKEVIENLPKDTPLSLEKDVLPNLVKNGKVFSYYSNTPYSDIGTPERYEKFTDDVMSGIIGL